MATTDNGGDVTLTDCGAVMSTGCESLSVTSMGFSEVSSSSPNTGGDYSEFYQRAQLITGLFLYPLFCLFGLIGNCLTIVVLRGRKLRSVTSMFLIALSLSDGVKLITDLFYFVVVLLLNTSPASGELAMGYMYPYAHYFFNASLCVTAWLTVSLAAERYILVCHVAHAKQWCNVNRAQLTIAVVYLSMSLFSMPFAFRYRTIWTEIQAGGNNDTSAVDFTTSGARPQYSVSIVVSSRKQFIG
jgi:hypothetical protein